MRINFYGKKIVLKIKLKVVAKKRFAILVTSSQTVYRSGNGQRGLQLLLSRLCNVKYPEKQTWRTIIINDRFYHKKNQENINNGLKSIKVNGG